MKKKQKAGLASLVLAASMFLISPGSTNKKNDVSEPINELPNIVAETITEPEELAMTLEYKEDSFTSEDEVLELATVENIEDTNIEEGNTNDIDDPSLDEESVIEETETLQKANYSFGYIKEDTKIYNASLDKEEIIEAYQKVIIIEKLEKVTVVEYTNEDNLATLGLVSNELLGELTGTYIEVDISDQIIRMYIDGELALESLVVTGDPYLSPTPIGHFNVLEKLEHTHLRGFYEDGTLKYCRFIDHGVRFYQGYVVHDAEYHSDPEIGITLHGWRTPEEFGGDTYLTHGSNGCPNTLNEVAEYIYEHSEEQTDTQAGTEVLIHR